MLLKQNNYDFLNRYYTIACCLLASKFVGHPFALAAIDFRGKSGCGASEIDCSARSNADFDFGFTCLLFVYDRAKGS